MKKILNKFSLLVAFCLLVVVVAAGCKSGTEPKLTPEQILKEKLIGEWAEVINWNDSLEQIYTYKPIHFVVFTEDSVFYNYVWEGWEPNPQDEKYFKISMGYQVIATDSIKLFRDEDYWEYHHPQTPLETENKITIYNSDSISIEHFRPMNGSLAINYPENHEDIYLTRKK